MNKLLINKMPHNNSTHMPSKDYSDDTIIFACSGIIKTYKTEKQSKLVLKLHCKVCEICRTKNWEREQQPDTKIICR